MFDQFALLFSQEAGEKANAQAPLLQFLFPLVAIGVLWYFLLIRPQQRERSKRDDLLGKLQKNDRVITVGGIFGTVANVSTEAKEVTLKIDDNTRIKVLRSSIQTVLTDDDGDSSR